MKKLSESDIEVRCRIVELYTDPNVKANLKSLRTSVRNKNVGFFKSGTGRYHSYYAVKKSTKLIFVPNDRYSEKLFLEFISDNTNLKEMERKIFDGLEYAFCVEPATCGLTVVHLPVLEL
ncbi:MAG: hypothetical protein EOP00_19520 [Pedobacter sp.]|nr:MAG: hypothetical protein EOP00_19520 [Pedobacter sp.]